MRLGKITKVIKQVVSVMSNAKVLNLSYLRIVEIARAINQNTIANKNRLKEKKIVTDKFIRKFSISRKDFSETLKTKARGIKYNSSTYLYDINDNFVEEVVAEKVEDTIEIITPKSEKLVEKKKDREKYYESNKNAEGLPMTNEMTGIKQIVSVKDDLFNMIEWYKSKITKEKLESNTLNEQIDINEFSNDLKGDVVVKYLKVYKDTFKRFEAICDKHKFIKKQDMLSVALLQFCKRYDK